MKFHLTIIFLFIIHFLFAQQNLILNSNFEEHHNDSVSQWEHTLSPYYHYAPLNINPHSGSKFIGLCIWKYDPTEYIQIKLTEKLEKEAEYELKMYVNYNSHIKDCWYDSITELDCYFSDTALYIKQRTQLYFKPQIVIPLNKNTLWVEKKEYFTAKGNENYLVIGKCFDHKDNLKDTTLIRIKTLQNQKLDSIEIEHETKKEEALAKIKRKYEANFIDLDKIKNKEKREKKMKEFRSLVPKMGLEMKKVIDSIENQYAFEIAKQKGENHCRIRINIDDITLTKSTLKNIIKSRDTIVMEKIFRLKNIFFETDKSKLLVKSFEELDKLFLMLKNNDSIKIEISGHTDNTGNETQNLLLSEARAKAVVNYLISKGIDKARMSYKGYGSSKPITTDNTEEGRAENRRVEFKILKK